MKVLDVEMQLRQGGFLLDAKFSVPGDGITAVFGPSGSGKSTLLAALAGLKRLKAGRIVLAGRVLDDVAARTHIPSHLRGIGLVFQDARLFPHLSVQQNLAYARVRAPDGTHRKTEEIAQFFDIVALLDRPIGNLSGGERSRVALARALMASPDFLLLDEPFAALDGARRHRFIGTLLAMHRNYALPMLVVTHDIDDAAALGSQLVALRTGQVVASGPFEEVARHPEFLSLLHPRDIGAAIPAPMLHSAGTDGRKSFWLRADFVLLACQRPQAISARNIIAGHVQEIMREASGSVLVTLQAPRAPILARITPQAMEELRLAVGKPAWAIVKAHALL